MTNGISDGHKHGDSHERSAVDGDKDHFRCDTQEQTVLIAEIKEIHRQRDDLLRAEGSLTRQIKAIGRRMKTGVNMSTVDLLSDVSALHLQAAKNVIHPGKLKTERQLRGYAKDLPVYSWMKSINGFGEIGLCQIIGECGNLSNFSSPAKIWKYLGLAPITEYPVGPNGGRLYSRRCRSMMYVIGDSLIKKQGPYRDLYLERKVYEVQKAENEGLTVAPQAKIPAKKKAEYRSEGHIHRLAQRYMEKRLLRNLWREWNKESKQWLKNSKAP